MLVTSSSSPGSLQEGAAIPPAVGSPSFAREDLQALYLMSGNRSFTSSIVINFFSRLLLWVRGMFIKSIGSPVSSFRNCRFLWL